jgi:chromate transporter
MGMAIIVTMHAHPESPALQETANRPGPASLSDLYWSLTFIALQGFGGVLAVVQRELVENKRWLSKEEFVEDWAVAQVLPGPNVVNLSLMIGDRHFGLKGAVVGVAGILSLPLVVVLALGIFFASFSGHTQVQDALRGMGAVSAGLIAATGIKLAAALGGNPMGRPVVLALAVAGFVGVALLRLPLAWVLFGLGVPACVWAWVCLARRETRNSQGGDNT